MRRIESHFQPFFQPDHNFNDRISYWRGLAVFIVIVAVIDPPRRPGW
jgi:hypothetical protein